MVPWFNICWKYSMNKVLGYGHLRNLEDNYYKCLKPKKYVCNHYKNTRSDNI